MIVADVVEFLTSKTGVFAAVTALLAMVGTIIGLVQPMLKRRREAADAKPKLVLSNVRINAPPPWSEAGEAGFELTNAGGGKAILSDLLLVVRAHGATEMPKMVEAAAPIPQFTYKVTLSPGVREYDVRKKEFGIAAAARLRQRGDRSVRRRAAIDRAAVVRVRAGHSLVRRQTAGRNPRARLACPADRIPPEPRRRDGPHTPRVESKERERMRTLATSLKHLVVVLTLAAVSGAGAQNTPRPQSNVPGERARGMMEEVKGWPALPASVRLGEVAGVDVDANGHVMIFHRPGRGFEPTATELLVEPAVIEIDADSGKLIASWGANTFLVPHGITIDAANNVFLTDVGLQQVFKFSHDGRRLLALGEARVGKWDATHFNQPTDIAIRADGSFYVSDGYVNSRVARFDPAGRFLNEWGRKGSGPGEFSNPHGLAFGPGGDVFVADRETARIQVFDRDGMFKRQWRGAKDIGRVFAVAVGPDGAIYAGVRRADYETSHTGVLKLDRDWKTVASVGFGAAGHPVFNAVHDLAIGRDGSIYVAETRTKRVVKLRTVK